MNLKDKVRDLLAQKNMSLAEELSAYKKLHREAKKANELANIRCDRKEANEAAYIGWELGDKERGLKILIEAEAKLKKLVAYEKQTA